MNDRREFLKKTGLLGLMGITSSLVSQEKLDVLDKLATEGMDPARLFELPKLPYSFNAMEPYIDEATMSIHYGKHHQSYVNKLNEQPAGTFHAKLSDEGKCKTIDGTTPAVIRNNLGGHVNHTLFWQLLKPNPEGKPNVPKGKLAEAIARDFKSFDEFKTQFTDKATKVFGSGWCWLIEQDGKLLITTTPNQDNPLMKVAEQKGNIVMALDVWEHAYYLKVMNKRADYIANWWNVANWDKAEELFVKK